MGFSSKNDVEDITKPLFVGGFCGVKKIEGRPDRPWYCLQFAVAPSRSRDNAFGWTVANCYVEQDVYQKFMISDLYNKRGEYQLMFVNHAWALISYIL